MVLRVLYVGSDKWFGKTGCLDFWLNMLMAHGTKVFFKVDDRMIAANPQAAASAAFLTGSADSLDASTAGAQRDAAHGHYARLMAQWRSRQGGDDPATVVRYTARGNLVAVITNGSAVPGATLRCAGRTHSESCSLSSCFASQSTN